MTRVAKPLTLSIFAYRSSVWMPFSGAIALVVGAMIFAELPSSATWVIGLLTGINMMPSGFAFFFARVAGDGAPSLNG